MIDLRAIADSYVFELVEADNRFGALTGLEREITRAR